MAGVKNSFQFFRIRVRKGKSGRHTHSLHWLNRKKGAGTNACSLFAYSRKGESRALQSPGSRRGETHPHPILLLEGEGVADKDNSIRSLARDTDVSRRREFAVPGGRVVRENLGLLPRGLHFIL